MNKENSHIPEKLLKPYDFNETETRIYKIWEESGFFNPDVCVEKGVTSAEAKPFTIMMPPPNVTGVLHMGHGLMLALEDVMVRYARMKGLRTLWLPGTDHAAIATQSKVEKEIQKKEKKSRHDIGREEMLKRIETFAAESHNTIVNQVRKMGASCDWSREAFTLDEKRSLAVRTAFKKMFDDGLIYRGHRIVNWDPKGQTTISDDEIVYEERTTTLYTFKYSKDFPISISTTRPETKVGDTAVAVHPDDTRYQKYIGKTFDILFVGIPLSIKVIGDTSVDKEFGTGAVGVTPAHSMTDADMAARHNLPMIQVIDERAKMTVGHPELSGKKTVEARDIIISKLKEEGLIEKEETITHNISLAERTNGVVEPLPKLQWFINVNKEFVLEYSKIDSIPSGSTTTLKKMMRHVVEQGHIKIVPEYFSKTYFHWIDNLRDWCISRQIWYGHRIPVWYRNDEIFCGTEAPQGEGWEQDPDTLDTWFSSGLWTFSTLGWPEQTTDLATYHPTDIIETGYEILPFWVARMILMTCYHTGDIPFRTAYFHGTVRDAQGRKMSKSLGNGIDPIEVADEFGADAGRMALIVGAAPGIDTRISKDKIKGYKHFANKVWNIGRFVLSNIGDANLNSKPALDPEDDKLLNELQETVTDITSDMDALRYHIASEKIYHYIWHRFADEILEESKNILKGEDAKIKSRQYTLLHIFAASLKILHPFMPFVTEELWSTISKDTLLMIEKWPA